MRKIRTYQDVPHDTGSGLLEQVLDQHHRLAERLALVRSVVAIASGKGGTGKSVVAASLACLLRGRGRTLLIDADMGVGNAHLMFDMSPAKSFVDVVAGRCEVNFRSGLTSDVRPAGGSGPGAACAPAREPAPARSGDLDSAILGELLRGKLGDKSRREPDPPPPAAALMSTG